jgi:endonuclease/exonuclease/phosphatase family metal-dependent hydrolase
MKLLTYNIHSCLGVDKRVDVDRTVSVIRAIAADVVALQEVENAGEAATSFLKKIKGLDYVSVIYGPTLARSGSDYGNLLLSRYPITSKQKIDLSWRKREPRGAISVRLATEWGHCRLSATHFGLGVRERKIQATRLLDRLEQDNLDDPAADILLGDLNEWRGFAGSLRLLRQRFQQISRCRTFPSILPVVGLDRILMASPTWHMSASIPDVPDGRTASDHLPLVADICKT